MTDSEYSELWRLKYRMTTMNTEPSEREEAAGRLKQIRERWPKGTKDDIDFLLSLLDSQGEEMKSWRRVAERLEEEKRPDFYETYNLRLSQASEAAATRMRECCLEKVKAMRSDWHDRYVAADSSSREALVRKEMLFAQTCAARDIIKELESLTLEGTKEQ